MCKLNYLFKIFPLGLLVFLSLSSFSQNRGTVYYCVSFFKEVDQVFPSTRKQTINEYKFNRGIGANVHYERYMNRKIKIGLEAGFWYFINNQVKTDALNREFRKRNILTPVLAHANFEVFDTKNIAMTLGLTGGPAYHQYINKFNDQSVKVHTKWTGIFGMELKIYIRLKRIPPPLKYNIFDLSFLRIDSKPVFRTDLQFWGIKL